MAIQMNDLELDVSRWLESADLLAYQAEIDPLCGLSVHFTLGLQVAPSSSLVDIIDVLEAVPEVVDVRPAERDWDLVVVARVGRGNAV
jgi:hypothetical protein